MNHRIFLASTAVLAVFIPQAALGADMNLSGSVNLHEFQNVSSSSLLLSVLASLAESIIPLIVSAIIGHKTIRYWQQRKSEISTRNSTITGYAQSFKRCNTLQDNFVDRVFEAYVTFERDAPQLASLNDYSYNEYNIHGFLKFPSEAAELPSSRFRNEYRELAAEIDNTEHARSHLYSILRLYHDPEKIMTKLDQIRDMLSKSEIILNKFFNSKNSDEFIRFRENYFAHSNKIAGEIRNMESEIIQLRFR